MLTPQGMAAKQTTPPGLVRSASINVTGSPSKGSESPRDSQGSSSLSKSKSKAKDKSSRSTSTTSPLLKVSAANIEKRRQSGAAEEAIDAIGPGGGEDADSKEGSKDSQ